MPTNAQRAILGGASALGSLFKGRIQALQARQSYLLGIKEQEQAQEKIDINRIFADAQLLGAQTQAYKAQKAGEDPIEELKRQIAQPILDKVNTAGFNALTDRELETYYALIGAKPAGPKSKPEVNDLGDLIGQYTAGNVSDEDFLKGTELYEAQQGKSAFDDLFLSLLKAHPGETNKQVLTEQIGAIQKFENKPVKMSLREIVDDAKEEADRQIREGHPGQMSRHFREVIEGNYDPEADDLEAKAQELYDVLSQDPVLKSYLERNSGGNK